MCSRIELTFSSGRLKPNSGVPLRVENLAPQV